MALIECTQKLLAQIDKQDEMNAEGDEGGLGNWHAHLMVFKRKKCVLFTNDQTLYSIVVPKLFKSDFKNLKAIFLDHLVLNLKYENLGHYALLILGEYQNKLKITKTYSRNVLGTMNNMGRFIEYFLWENGGLENADCLELNKYINRIPFKPIQFAYPIERLRKKLGEISDIDK